MRISVVQAASQLGVEEEIYRLAMTEAGIDNASTVTELGIDLAATIADIVSSNSQLALSPDSQDLDAITEDFDIQSYAEALALKAGESFEAAFEVAVQREIAQRTKAVISRLKKGKLAMEISK